MPRSCLSGRRIDEALFTRLDPHIAIQSVVKAETAFLCLAWHPRLAPPGTRPSSPRRPFLPQTFELFLSRAFFLPSSTSTPHSRPGSLPRRRLQGQGKSNTIAMILLTLRSDRSPCCGHFNSTVDRPIFMVSVAVALLFQAVDRPTLTVSCGCRGRSHADTHLTQFISNQSRLSVS